MSRPGVRRCIHCGSVVTNSLRADRRADVGRRHVEPEPALDPTAGRLAQGRRADARRVGALGAAVGQRVEHGLRRRVARRADRQVDQPAGQRRRDRASSVSRRSYGYGGGTKPPTGRRRRHVSDVTGSAPAPTRRAPTRAGRPMRRTVAPAPSRTPRPHRSTRPRPRDGRRRARRHGRTGSRTRAPR